jgi:hypothetical protein
VKEWQSVITAMVKRYSVEKKYVTHWAVANEINIGEYGGCPYKFTSPHDFFEYYKMTVEAVLKAWPDAKIGGPAWAGSVGGGEEWEGSDGETKENAEHFLGTFLDLVKQENLKLDFISYNMYYDDQRLWLNATQLFSELIRKHNKTVELYITEMNVKLDDNISFEENAYLGARAASLSATILALHDTKLLNGTFQYHIVDQHNDVSEFVPFYGITRYMAHHWNDYPHRLGLFDWDGKPRPQYFMYKLLYEMDGERLGLDTGGNANIHAVASNGGDRDINIFISNYHDENPKDMISKLCLKNNPIGLHRLTVYRIDGEKRWDDALTLIPVEERTAYTSENFEFLVFTPADSVTLIYLKSLEAAK